MRLIFDIIGAVTSLIMIIAGVWLSATKSPCWILVLPAALGLWVFVSLCDQHLMNAAVPSDSRDPGRRTTRK
jgi:hypothetical protein